LTETAYEHIQDRFRFEEGDPGYALALDDFSAEQLGEYDIIPAGRKHGRSLLLDRSPEALFSEIERAVKQVEPLASYLPQSILNLLVESAARRQIPPNFLELTAMFVNFIGLPEAVDRALPGEEEEIVTVFSRAFALINAAVDARGGVLKNVTYHLAGSDMLIYFGVPNAHIDDPLRAAYTALAIRSIIMNLEAPIIGGKPVVFSCQIGMARGAAFAAEIGEPRGRREFNVLGDTINIAARLMGKAKPNQILMTETMYQALDPYLVCEPVGSIPLKGKAQPLPVFSLEGKP
jgi:class 3 adenylate cyclase